MVYVYNVCMCVGGGEKVAAEKELVTHPLTHSLSQSVSQSIHQPKINSPESRGSAA